MSQERQEIPRAVAMVVGEVLGNWLYNHARIERLFKESGAPGEPRDLNCVETCREWLLRCNKDSSVSPMTVLWGVIEDFMTPEVEVPRGGASSAPPREEGMAKIASVLARNGLAQDGAADDAQPWTALIPCPDLSVLVGDAPKLTCIIKRRWGESQRCQQAEADLAAVVLMGSILEALLLTRCIKSPAVANRSSRAPRTKDKSRVERMHDWSLNSLIDVAVDVGWLNSDRAKFSHALRMSRNLVHPWAEMKEGTSFDEGTCRTCWEVLRSSVADLCSSVD